VASGAVSCCLGHLDGNTNRAALAAREVGAVNDNKPDNGTQVSLSEIGGLVNMLDRACGEFHKLEDKLEGVPLMSQSLTSLMEGQKELGTTVKRIERAQSDAQIEHLKEAGLQREKIQAISSQLKNYDDVVKKVNDLETKLFGYVLVVIVLWAITALVLAVFGPNWVARPTPEKASAIITSELQRGEG
jgi:hypothetical protein